MSRTARLVIFTICSNNYVPSAKVFFESARQHNPEADLFLCLVDKTIDVPGLYDPDWRLVEAERLDIPDFQSFAFRYDIMELNTAVKPFMFRYLLEDLDYEVALYFDPDIEIFRPLDAITTRLRRGASFVLTPHLCSPNEAAEEPNDFTVMRAGVYNLGFLGAARGAESSRIIDWWCRRLRFYCISAQDRGIFVDQKFMDLVPGFAPNSYVSQDTTLNVAYWNLGQRRLEERDGAWFVDDAPLTFFHYSGFDPRKPSRLSKYATAFDGDMPQSMRRLTARYAGRLLASGYGAISDGTYAYGRFASGATVHVLARRMFREWHRFWPDDPFETYEAFLDEPWPGASRQLPGHVVTNFMRFLHGCFPILHNRLDLAKPDHVRELIHWFVTQAPREIQLDLRLIEPAALRMGLHQRPPRPVRNVDRNGVDVTVVGYLKTASGVGEVGRQTLLTLASGGVAVEGYDVALGVAAQRDDSSCTTFLTKTGTAPVQIFNINADQLRVVIDHTRARLHPDAIRINIPFWELSRFPSPWLSVLAEMDEIWAPSRFIQTSIAGRLDRPVIYMPVAFELPPTEPLPRDRFGLPTNMFLFFYAFDFLSFIERKNPHGVVAAFRMAFPHGGQAGLVLKCMNGAAAPEQFALFREEIEDSPGIFLLDATLDRGEMLGLIAAMDAVISLHRSEGLGLLIAEAMLLEKPVIATGYSASREFLSDATGYPVGFQLVPVGDGEYPFHEGQVWASPDLPHAAWLMRRLRDSPGCAAPRVARAAHHMRANYSRAHVAQLQASRLRILSPVTVAVL